MTSSFGSSVGGSFDHVKRTVGVAALVRGEGAWGTVRAALLVLGYYAILVGVGLLVLYLAVRVVRAAWKRG